MLLTFTIFSANFYADITMFKGDALTLLKMMGYSAAEPGAIPAADVPQALSRLTVAIDAIIISLPVNDEDADESWVIMANRGLPLINFFTDAAKTGCGVMWR